MRACAAQRRGEVTSLASRADEWRVLADQRSLASGLARGGVERVSRPVDEATLRALHELWKWGPTSTNQQPLRVVWCVGDAAKARLAALCAPGNAKKVLAAPVSAVLGMAFFAGTTVRVNFITTLGYGDSATLYPRAPRLEFEETNLIR